MLTVATAEPRLSDSLMESIGVLDRAFGIEFHAYDIAGECLRTGSEPSLENATWLDGMLRGMTHARTPQFLIDNDYCTALAFPLRGSGDEIVIALAPFVLRDDALPTHSSARHQLGLSDEVASQWIARRPAWPLHALQRMAQATHAHLRDQAQLRRQERDLEKISANLVHCYEEVTLLHNVTQNFRISISDEELGNLVLDWIMGCLPCETACVVHLPVAKASEITYKARTDATLISRGKPLFADASDVTHLVEVLGIAHGCRPLVANRQRYEFADLLPEGISQLILAPLVEGSRVLGYLLAVNHIEEGEFGTVEANLLSSVGAMLGIHCANRDLYREQAELLASVVRALTSAIDAKDPYTCGHSDRVARVATRIAQELECDKDFLSTIYMAGLLHDIGKIGIDDAVLRKPGPLTEEEFEHIKQHPGLGYKILADIKQLSHVLPAVLHHHEQWDGRGYPCKLAADQIPFIARILAVADAYDAMTSDRPYRAGMPTQRVEKIFREGAGRQWDAQVIDAFFRCSEEIHQIVGRDRADLSLDVQSWLSVAPNS